MTDTKHPPRRPSGSFVTPPVKIDPHRPTTQTLVAAGATTHDVAESEDRISAIVYVPAMAVRAVREALLKLAHTKYEEGKASRDAVLREHAVATRMAYWQAAAIAEKRERAPDARPLVADVLAAMQLESATVGLPTERDVRALLRVFGLMTAD